jgi:hypothetical protein
MKLKRYMAVRTLKALFKLSFVLVEAVFAAEKSAKPRYGAHKAQELYDDGLIGDTEYARCTRGE